MKNLQPILFLLFFLLLADSGFSQRKFAGRVTEVIDGKTVVIEMETGKLTAVLQYIEIPEPEQPLFGTVRDHLKKLVLGRYVDFQPQAVMPIKTLGQLYADGVDIAQQMLRDGAAWHINADQSGQDTKGNSVYQYSQDQAKSEKRGVWSVENMKPAWQFRADKKEIARLSEERVSGQSAANGNGSQPVLNRSTRPARRKPPGYWGDPNPALKNVGALFNGYNARTRTGYVGTSLMGVVDKEKEDERTQTAIDITYIYKEGERKGRKGIFVVSVESVSPDWRFLKSNNLTVTADEKSIAVAKPKRTTWKDGDLVRERLTYEVARSTIEKIVHGGNVVLKVGDYLLKPENQTIHLLLYNMLQIAE